MTEPNPTPGTVLAELLVGNRRLRIRILEF